MSKKVKSVIGTRDDKQWPTEGGALKDGCTGVADASARASWCVCRVAQATIPSLTARRVTGEIGKLTPSSRRAEGASLLEHLRSRSSAAPAPCDRADPLGSTDGEVQMGAQPPLVVFVSVYGCFCKCHKSPSSERFPTAPHNPVRRRSAGSCAPIDRLHSAYGSWVFVSTSLVQELIWPCNDYDIVGRREPA